MMNNSNQPVKVNFVRCCKIHITGLMLVVSHVSSAQDIIGASIPIGDSRLTPSIELAFQTNDNIFLTSDNTQSTSGIVLSPSVQWEASRGTTSLALSYSGAFASFGEERLNFDDHQLELSATQELNKRLLVSGDISILREHEDLGANVTAGIGETLDEQLVYNDLALNTRLVFGARQALGNFRLGLGYLDRNAASLQDIAGPSEFTSLRSFAEFALRVSPDTRFIIGASFADIEFAVESRDREITGIYAGFNFAPTGRVAGSLTVGASSVESTSSAGDSSEELTVNASLKYEARSFSIFTLSARRDFDLSDELVTGLDDVNTLQNRLSLGWRYNWSSLLFHQAGIGLETRDRTCPSRSTQTNNARLSLNYFIKRWLIVGASFSVDSRSTDECSTGSEAGREFDYDRQIIGVNFQATL